MSCRFFGTDGVRGPYGGPVINESFAARLGAAAARQFLKKGRPGGVALLGRDTRASGATLLDAVASGIAAAGVKPLSMGVAPTPAVALSVSAERALFGVMITASHNPAEDNGIKFFGGAGTKLSAGEEETIENLLPSEEAVFPEVRPSGSDALDGYLEKVGALLPGGTLDGWLVAYDGANGAACATSPKILTKFGANLVSIGDAPDGRNINAGVGSEHPEVLMARVNATGARIGIAQDGDGDRCVLVDEQGALLDGDEILTILAIHALERNRLPGKTLVVTVQSNLAVDVAVTRAGGRVVRTDVGDRNVSEGMRREGALLGGESSGHVICGDVSPTGDGLVAAIRVIQVMLETGRPLSELRTILQKFPQRTATLTIRERLPLEELTALREARVKLETELGERGRVLIRYSGTEPRLRFLVEGPDRGSVEAGIGRLLLAARSDLKLPG